MKIKHLIKIAKRVNAKRMNFYFREEQFAFNEFAGFYFDRITITIDSYLICVHVYYKGINIGFIGEKFYGTKIDSYSNFCIALRNNYL